MAKESELMRKRKEAKEEILAMKENIPSARILNQLGKAFKPKSLGYWLSNIVLLNIFLLSPWALIGLAFSEIEKTGYLWIPGIITIEGVVAVLVLVYIVVQSILDDVADLIIEKINNTDDLTKLLHWLKEIWSNQQISKFVLLFCIRWTSLGVGGVSISSFGFPGFGYMLTVLLVGSLAGIGFYTAFWISMLASNLGNYQYEINTLSPADSEIINNISEMLTKRVYILALYFAVFTLISSLNLIDKQIKIVFSLPLFVIAWITITAQFLLIRSTIGKIVERAKWKTLNKLQTKINSIEATGDLSDKETAEKLLRLADIYKRVIASRINTFDLKSLPTLFSQLMLPLLGLLLGNLEKISALLP